MRRLLAGLIAFIESDPQRRLWTHWLAKMEDDHYSRAMAANAKEKHNAHPDQT